MYNSFVIKNFRCFSEISLNDLDQVNLITGMNNTGKTALLEAIFIHGGRYNPSLVFTINALRGLESWSITFAPGAETPWDLAFFEFDNSKEIELGSYSTKDGKKIVRLREIKEAEGKALYSLSNSKIFEMEYQNGKRKPDKYQFVVETSGKTGFLQPLPIVPYQTWFLSSRGRQDHKETARRFTKLNNRGEKHYLLEALKIIEPRLEDISLGLVGDNMILHGDIGSGKQIPLPIMGDGMGRIAELFLGVADTPNGVTLMDEVENGLHYSVLPKLWKVIGQAARKYNSQVFATTHSRECIVAAHKAFKEPMFGYDFKLHRLERAKDGNIRAVTYDQGTLEAAIESEFEVR